MKWNFILLPLELSPCRTLWSGDFLWARVFCWSSGRGTNHTGTEASLTDQVSAARAQGLGFIVSMFAASFGAMLLTTANFLFMLRGRGRKCCKPVPLPLERSLCVYHPEGSTLRRENNLPLHTPGVVQIVVSMLSASEFFACLFSKNRTILSGLYPQPSLLTLKSPGLDMCGQGLVLIFWGRCPPCLD